MRATPSSHYCALQPVSWSMHRVSGQPRRERTLWGRIALALPFVDWFQSALLLRWSAGNERNVSDVISLALLLHMVCYQIRAVAQLSIGLRATATQQIINDVLRDRVAATCVT